MSEAGTVHADAVRLGTRVVLIRGRSGAGKSQLALEVLAEAARRGWSAALVGDDRVRLEAHGGRLVAFAPPVIAGLIEVRGLGIVEVAHEAAGVVGLVVDLEAERPPRLPEEEVVTLAGVEVPSIRIVSGDRLAVQRVVIALRRTGNGAALR